MSEALGEIKQPDGACYLDPKIAADILQTVDENKADATAMDYVAALRQAAVVRVNQKRAAIVADLRENTPERLQQLRELLTNKEKLIKDHESAYEKLPAEEKEQTKNSYEEELERLRKDAKAVADRYAEALYKQRKKIGDDLSILATTLSSPKPCLVLESVESPEASKDKEKLQVSNPPIDMPAIKKLVDQKIRTQYPHQQFKYFSSRMETAQRILRLPADTRYYEKLHAECAGLLASGQDSTLTDILMECLTEAEKLLADVAIDGFTLNKPHQLHLLNMDLNHHIAKILLRSGRRRLAPSSSHTTVRAMSHTAV